MKFLLPVAAIISGLFTGCYTPQFMPATNIECRVIDDETKQPISGAELFMVYVGASGQTVKRGPFLSDQNGVGFIKVESEAIWQSGAEAGFAGGHLRHIEVRKTGYEESGFWENFDRGLLERKAPFTFSLKPPRNRFGAVLVLSIDRSGEKPFVSLEVVDGPNAGERIILPYYRTIPAFEVVGIRLYLTQSFEQIRSDFLQHKILAFDLTYILRTGESNEPYRPPQ
jgi:hypothetical protein